MSKRALVTVADGVEERPVHVPEHGGRAGQGRSREG